MAGSLKTGKARLALALGVFVIWMLITGFTGRLFSGGEPASLDQLMSQGVVPQVLLACVFVVAASFLFPRSDIGLVAPVSRRSLLLTLPVAVYLALFFGMAFYLGLPSPRIVGFVVVNALLVGVSEELACRGVLFQGFRSRFRVWPAIWLTSLIFAAMHVLNGFVTGQFGIAAIQSLAAFCTGMLFMAIRVRTGSIYPCVVLHGLWNTGALLAVLAAVHKSGGHQANLEMGLIMALPVLGVLPNLLYGLWLLRHAARDEARATGAGGI
jgi:membrane protease YdiL (CAAX protease family)